MTEIKNNQYCCSVKSNSARDFVDALMKLAKKHKQLKIDFIVTPDEKLKFDPITFEPTNKTYGIYGAVLTK